MNLMILFYFCISFFTKESFQSTDDLSIDSWKLITINPGKNTFSFGIVSDASRFLTISIHSPFNKIWVSLFDDCPTASSQYGYNLGLVKLKRVINATQNIFVCSFSSRPIEAAVRALLDSSESVVPGGCGIDSTDYFATSTIITHWAADTNLIASSTIKTISQKLQWWTSSIRFYAASPPRIAPDECASEYRTNASVFNNIVYHIYHSALVPSGDFGRSHTTPTATDVLTSLSRLSSHGDAAMHGTLVSSINARDLKLFEDNSHEVQIARHLGTASVVNVVAEYKMDSLPKLESSLFVAYAPTVLYTCPHIEKPSSEQFYTASDQLTCHLLLDASIGTRFCVGLIFLGALIFAFSGSYLVWLRCGISIVLMSSFVCLAIFYRHIHASNNAAYLVVAGGLIPIASSLLLMTLIYCCCIRKSYVQDTVPLSPSIFNSLHEYRPPLFNRYGAIGDVDDAGHSADDSVSTGHSFCCTTALRNALCCCCYNRWSNQYRLWRLARFVSTLPAVLILTSLILSLLTRYLDTLKNPTGHLLSFSFIYIALIVLLYNYKNLAFGLSVSFTGLYIGLTCVTLLFLPNSWLPYVLVDEFLILTWPRERLRIHDISVYGKNDIIILMTWLGGSVICGLMTMCTLHLSDSKNYNARCALATGGLREPYAAALAGTRTTSGWLRWWSPRQCLFRRWRNRIPFINSNSSDVDTGMDEGEGRAPSVFAGSDIYENLPAPTVPSSEQQRLLQTAIVWPPQPFTHPPLVPAPLVERRVLSDRRNPIHDAVIEAPPLPLSPRLVPRAADGQLPSRSASTTASRNPFDFDDFPLSDDNEKP